jgi:hypothetical protein
MLTNYQRVLDKKKKEKVRKMVVRKEYYKTLKKEGMLDSKRTGGKHDNQRDKKQIDRNAKRANEEKDKQEKANEVEKEALDKEKRRRDRERENKAMKKRTSKGQILMAPRINVLLEKIKRDIKNDK